MKCLPKMRMGNAINSFQKLIPSNEFFPFNLSNLKNLIKSLENRNPILPGKSMISNEFYRDK